MLFFSQAKYERASVLLKRTGAAAKEAAEAAARAHAAEVGAMRRATVESDAEAEARLCAAEARAEASRAQMGREGRERLSLQREVEEVSSPHVE